jgi:hypothetical protein
MSFAAAVAKQPALPVMPIPAHHVQALHPFTVLIDFDRVLSDSTRAQRNSFVLRDLAAPADEISGVYMLPASQLLRVNFKSEGPYLAALAKLRGGVPCSAAEGRTVCGWSPSDTITKVRLCGVPERLSKAAVWGHMGLFGQVLSAMKGMDEDYPSAADGVVYFTLLLKEGATLPSFINVVDHEGTLAEVIMVHTDQGRRHCYRCGHTGHQARFCRAAHRHPGAPASLWSTLVLTLPAAPAVPAPPASPAPATPATLAPAPARAASAASPKREKPAALATPSLPSASASSPPAPAATPAASPPAPAATPAADPLDPGEGQVLTLVHEKEEGYTGSPERSRSPLRPEKFKKLPKKRPK